MIAFVLISTSISSFSLDFCIEIDTYHLNINELYLETHVRGQPHPKVEWFKDSADISRTDPKYQVFDHPDGLCELIVNFPNSGDR